MECHNMSDCHFGNYQMVFSTFSEGFLHPSIMAQRNRFSILKSPQKKQRISNFLQPTVGCLAPKCWFRTVGGSRKTMAWFRTLRAYHRHLCRYGVRNWSHPLLHTSSAARGGGGNFKNKKPIGEVGCFESRITEQNTD